MTSEIRTQNVRPGVGAKSSAFLVREVIDPFFQSTVNVTHFQSPGIVVDHLANTQHSFWLEGIIEKFGGYQSDKHRLTRFFSRGLKKKTANSRNQAVRINHRPQEVWRSATSCALKLRDLSGISTHCRDAEMVISRETLPLEFNDLEFHVGDVLNFETRIPDQKERFFF